MHGQAARYSHGVLFDNLTLIYIHDSAFSTFNDGSKITTLRFLHCLPFIHRHPVVVPITRYSTIATCAQSSSDRCLAVSQ
jgi:hypothetical protein